MRLPSQRRATSGRPHGARRAGVTLIELLVVLVVIGIGTAVVVPGLRTAPDVAGVPDPIAASQQLAVQRGESLRLEVAADGHWSLLRAAEPDDTVARGAGATGAPVVLSLLPSGACVPVSISADRGAWDPVGCAWSSESGRP